MLLNFNTLPIPRQPFDKVVSTDIFIIREGGVIRWVNIDKIGLLNTEFHCVAMSGSILFSIVKHCVINSFNSF